MPNSLKFGTSGLRGLASDLVGEESRRYAAAFVRHTGGQRHRAILVGRDLRASSRQIAADVIAAITGQGLEALDCGELPTPALALESQLKMLPAIMVTGSHIPADRNGLKFYAANGEIDKTDEAGIIAMLSDAPAGRPVGTAHAAALRHYRDRYLNMLPHGSLAGLRIGIWQHSSVMRDLLGDMLDHFGAEVVALGRSETFIPVDTEAVSEDRAAELAGWVHAHQLDAIVSTDGDADRPLVVDETGALLRGDVIGILTARFLRADIVVTPVTSNSSIEAMAEFKRVVRTKVGSPYVIAGMNAALSAAEGHQAVIGFEANGGVLLGTDVEMNGTWLEALPTRDAMLPILSVLGAVRAARQSLSQLVATLPRRFARSDRLEHVPQERSAALIETLETDAAGFLKPQGTIKATSVIDGMRFELANGDVIHYRPSGNAPELRCYTEASSSERAEALLAWGLKAAEAIVR